MAVIIIVTSKVTYISHGYNVKIATYRVEQIICVLCIQVGDNAVNTPLIDFLERFSHVFTICLPHCNFDLAVYGSPDYVL